MVVETPRRRIVALDVGLRRVGLAASDELGLIASPIESIDLRRGGLGAVVDAIRRLDPELIVVGLPRTMAGHEGTQAELVRQFARDLAEHLPQRFTFWDERLSTAAAERMLIAAKQSRRARKERVDAVAAALILQSYLDAHPR